MFEIQDIRRIAKRYNNPNRQYLLVNPLQSKYIPSDPSKSLEMMTALGQKVATNTPGCRLVIGFAETATAIGAAVAKCYGSRCTYMHTTREDIPRCIDFLEEHSHAKQHLLYTSYLSRRINATNSIVFVDDEISTGKTIINLVNRLKEHYPMVKDKKLVFASILNRLSPENEELMLSNGISVEYLVREPYSVYEQELAGIEVIKPERPEPSGYTTHMGYVTGTILNPRYGVNAAQYHKMCLRLADEITRMYATRLKKTSRLLLLGTEECMYPAIVVGDTLKRNNGLDVRCQATARSPIGLCSAEGYPIHNGYQVNSFYDTTRETFWYNVEEYDAAIVITDGAGNITNAMDDVESILRTHGCNKIYFVKG